MMGRVCPFSVLYTLVFVVQVCVRVSWFDASRAECR